MDFDWSILERQSAMAMVRGQLGFSWGVLSHRLEGLTDAEWAWEPTPGAWSVAHAQRRKLVQTGQTTSWVPENG